MELAALTRILRLRLGELRRERDITKKLQDISNISKVRNKCKYQIEELNIRIEECSDILNSLAKEYDNSLVG